MRKKTIGEVLRLTRVNQKLTLADVSKKTDIKTDYLKALENNQYEKFPNAFYVRSLLRKYAWALDLDETILLEAYDTDNTVVYDEIELAENEEFRSRKYKNRSFSLPLFYFLVVALSIIIFVTYYVWQYANTTTPQFTSSDSYSLVSSSSLEDRSTPPETSTTDSSSTKEKLEVTGEGNYLIAKYRGESQTTQLTISANNTSSWISVTNTDLAAGTTLTPAQSSQTVTLSPNTTYTITLGVVKGVTVTVGSQKIDLSTLTSDSAIITLTIES